MRFLNRYTLTCKPLRTLSTNVVSNSYIAGVIEYLSGLFAMNIFVNIRSCQVTYSKIIENDKR